MTRINVIYTQRADCVNGPTFKCLIGKCMHTFRKVVEDTVLGNYLYVSIATGKESCIAYCKTERVYVSRGILRAKLIRHTSPLHNIPLL
jgi:hypothetical protein